MTPSTLSPGLSSAATSPSDEARFDDASRWSDDAVERAAERAEDAVDQSEVEDAPQEPQPPALEEATGEGEGMLSGSLLMEALPVALALGSTGLGEAAVAEEEGGGASARAPATTAAAAAGEAAGFDAEGLAADELVGPRESGRATVDDFWVRSVRAGEPGGWASVPASSGFGAAGFEAAREALSGGVNRSGPATGQSRTLALPERATDRARATRLERATRREGPTV